MTPRTVDHLAKTLGCDPVTPFDGDSLANIDSDDYPWLNTPNLAAPATPAQARHTNIASLARFDARPVATPKHIKSDSKTSSSNALAKSTNDTKVPSSGTGKAESRNNKASSDKPQDRVSSQEQTINSFSPTNTNSSPQKSAVALTIPPFNPSNHSNQPPSQTNQSHTGTNINNQSMNSSMDKPRQSAPSRGDSRLSTSPAGSAASLKAPDSNSSTSSATTSPIKQPNKPVQPNSSARAGYTSSSNRLSPAGSGTYFSFF